MNINKSWQARIHLSHMNLNSVYISSIQILTHFSAAFVTALVSKLNLQNVLPAYLYFASISRY